MPGFSGQCLGTLRMELIYVNNLDVFFFKKIAIEQVLDNTRTCPLAWRNRPRQFFQATTGNREGCRCIYDSAWSPLPADDFMNEVIISIGMGKIMVFEVFFVEISARV